MVSNSLTLLSEYELHLLTCYFSATKQVCAMPWSNLHTHTFYCDGKANPEEYIEEALKNDIAILGFSGHFPLPFSNEWAMPAQRLHTYMHQIELLKQKYKGKLDIYLGTEVDYIPSFSSPVNPAVIKANFDFTIGSIHYVDTFFDGRPWQVDGRHLEFLQGLKDIFHYNVKEVVRRYYALTRDMINNASPDILGHLDKIKVQNWDNQFFHEADRWYHNEVVATLEIMKQKDVILEVNTRGMYRRRSLETFPSRWILEIAYDLDIPVMLASDAHHPVELSLEFRPAARMLRDIGFRYLRTLLDGQWVDVPFNSFGLQLGPDRSRIVA